VPVAVGAKMMFAVQLEDAARDEPHVLLKMMKSPGFAPVKSMLLIVIAVVPAFVNVTIFCPPLPPTGTETQLRVLGETDTCANRTVPGKIGSNTATRKMLPLKLRRW
jgi:hypothetical protein